MVSDGEVPRADPHHVVESELHDQPTLGVDLLVGMVVSRAFELGSEGRGFEFNLFLINGSIRDVRLVPIFAVFIEVEEPS